MYKHFLNLLSSFGLIRVSLLKGRELTSLPSKLPPSQGVFIMATLECSTTGSWRPKPNNSFFGHCQFRFHRWGKIDQAVLSYKAALRINPNLKSAQENLKRLSWKQNQLTFCMRRSRKESKNVDAHKVHPGTTPHSEATRARHTRQGRQGQGRA